MCITDLYLNLINNLFKQNKKYLLAWNASRIHLLSKSLGKFILKT